MKNGLKLISCLFILAQFTFAQSKAPENIQAAMFIKVLGLNKNLSGDINIHVMDNDQFVTELKKQIGKKVGGGVLKSVSSGGTITPGSQVVYVNSEGQMGAVTTYTQANKAISITGEPSLVKAGISLGIGVLANKPKVIFNVNSAKAEGSAWNPAIFKLAKKV